MSIGAIIVTYNPDFESFIRNLNKISKQVDQVFIIDNTPSSNNISELLIRNTSHLSNVIIYQFGYNAGIALAQNVGYKLAIQMDLEFIINFDQDSLISDNFVNLMMGEYTRASKIHNIKIAAIGPTVINERSGMPYTKHFKNSIEITEDIFSMKCIISSGMLIKLDSILSIGFNKAEWFIDSIDTEWCYRAVYLGYSILTTKNVTMNHNLGVSDILIPGVHPVNIGAPFRLYYVYRNWIFSLREPHFPFGRKLKLLFFIPVKFCLFSLVKPRRERMKYMIKGIKDGIFKRHSMK